MGSVGSSQSSRCVFDKVCSSRISESGISGYRNLFVIRGSLKLDAPILGLLHLASLLLQHVSEPRRIFFLHSVLPLVPPKFNPGHGHQNVADPSRESRNRDNSWLQFNRLFNNRGTASPTQPQSVGGNYSPASALKPHILTYINYSSTVSYYIFTSPCFYHSSANITYNISHTQHLRQYRQYRAYGRTNQRP